MRDEMMGQLVFVGRSFIGICNEGRCKDDESHLASILNYFIHLTKDARAEGINSIIAQMENMTFGYRTMEHLNNANILRVAI